MLRSLVRQHGIGSVLKSLGDIASDDFDSSLVNTAGRPRRRKEEGGNRPRRKYAAKSYVARMHLPGDTQRTLALIAERFDQKAFLPTFRDIAVFCESHGIDVPRSTARASAIPRIFKFMAQEMGNSEIERIWDEAKFAGPVQLGPIADAIERNGRASRTASLAPTMPRATEDHSPRWYTARSNSEVH